MRAWMLPAALLALVAGLAAAALDDDQSSWTFTNSLDPSLPPTVEAPLDPAPPNVVREGLQVARDDAILRTLAAEGSARLARTGDWWGIDDRAIGVHLVFRLRRPIAVDDDLPVADVPPDAPTEGECESPYRQTWLHERASGVTQLRVLVDLRRDRVAEIGTNAQTGRRSWVSGKPHPSCRAVASG